ncbi:uncharacterized protein LOC124716873 [Schistocerca piceifrons]|uniref:uncharacterized protein LOC124716873 n=1 Tax=Schistocerca piceifrons TaxID=274613 RepID=UPI001F5EAAAD|nr:uncharacterized protein LOC124716873 [Schistocerca piceifrons]
MRSLAEWPGAELGRALRNSAGTRVQACHVTSAHQCFRHSNHLRIRRVAARVFTTCSSSLPTSYPYKKIWKGPTAIGQRVGGPFLDCRNARWRKANERGSGALGRTIRAVDSPDRGSSVWEGESCGRPPGAWHQPGYKGALQRWSDTLQHGPHSARSADQLGRSTNPTMNGLLALTLVATLVAACSGGLLNHGGHYGGATSYQNVHIESHGSVPVPVASGHHGGFGGGHGIALADGGHHGLELGAGLLQHDGGLGLAAIGGGHDFGGHLEGGFDGGYGGGLHH